MTTPTDEQKKKMTTVSYKVEQVTDVANLITQVLHLTKVPMPLAVLAFEMILDHIKKSGVVFERGGPRLVRDEVTK